MIFVCSPKCWLWEACWHQSVSESYEIPILAGSEMMMMSMPMATMELAVSEPSVEEQADSIQEALDFLNNLWKTDKELRKSNRQAGLG